LSETRGEVFGWECHHKIDDVQRGGAVALHGRHYGDYRAIAGSTCRLGRDEQCQEDPQPAQRLCAWQLEAETVLDCGVRAYRPCRGAVTRSHSLARLWAAKPLNYRRLHASVVQMRLTAAKHGRNGGGCCLPELGRNRFRQLAVDETGGCSTGGSNGQSRYPGHRHLCRRV
jgi:hypothetical protein